MLNRYFAVGQKPDGGGRIFILVFSGQLINDRSFIFFHSNKIGSMKILHIEMVIKKLNRTWENFTYYKSMLIEVHTKIR